ncbi:MAG: hypothetical protein RR144_02970 [Clostridia bacterium]
MDNAQKAIMIGVGLFITIIVIAAVMAITGIGTDLLNQGQSQLGGLSAQIEQQLTAEYDNVQMSGAQVRAAIQKYYNDPKMVVGVNNSVGSNTAGTITLTWVTSNHGGTGALANTNGDNAFVAAWSAPTANVQSSLNSYTNNVVSTAQYQAKLVKLNGQVIGIAFLRR